MLFRAAAGAGGSRAEARAAPAAGAMRAHAARRPAQTRRARRIAGLLSDKPLFWRHRLTDQLLRSGPADLASLSLAQRAGAVTALQEGPTVEREERAIAKVLLATQGAELTALKDLVDVGDHHDMVELVFDDIDDAQVRAQVLAHISAQAPGAPRADLKVLSDIDDTLKASLNDARFPKGTVYPGVRQFYRELDLGPAGTGDDGDLGFLTARPELEGLGEDLWTRKSLADLGLPRVSILSGDIAGLLGHDAMAAKKTENFEAFHAVFPEHPVVFIGDSGQGDEAAGRQMLAKAPEHVPAVFIHDLDGTKPKGGEDVLVFFDTYVGAAVVAHARGLIGNEGLARVAAAALQELDAVPFDDPAKRKSAQEMLQKDLAAAAERLAG